jgi:hypothetical protein
MKKLFSLLLIAVIGFSSCNSSRQTTSDTATTSKDSATGKITFLKGKKHELFLGSDRVREKKARERAAKIGASEFSNQKN